MAYSYDGIPSDLVTDAKEGSRGLKVVSTATKPIQSKSYSYYPDGSLHTVITTDENGTITTETYTWDANGNPSSYAVS